MILRNEQALKFTEDWVISIERHTLQVLHIKGKSKTDQSISPIYTEGNAN